MWFSPAQKLVAKSANPKRNNKQPLRLSDVFALTISDSGLPFCHGDNKFVDIDRTSASKSALVPTFANGYIKPFQQIPKRWLPWPGNTQPCVVTTPLSPYHTFPVPTSISRYSHPRG